MKLFTDGGSRGNPGNAACAYFLFDGESLYDFGGKYLGVVSNNVAEYRGLTQGLKAAEKLGIDTLEVFMDSELIVKQVNGIYQVKNDDMKVEISKVMAVIKSFKMISFTHVLREKNKFADRLVNTILDSRE
jgi:ribonuclease HI